MMSTASGEATRAEVTLVGSNTDWLLVKRIWTVLAPLRHAIAWDEMSGFEVNDDAPGATA